MHDKATRTNLERFYDIVEMPGGWSFNHVENLKTIDLYYNSKYKTGQYDNKGFRKFFYNIVKPACDVATKFIDLDTKDIILKPERAGDEFKVWLMQRKLKQWLKDNKFAELLNEISFDYPKYGHVVIKKSGKRWNKVSLANLRVDPSVDYMKNSDFVYELHNVTEAELMDMGASDEALEELKARGTCSTYLVYECYDRKGKGWNRSIKADLFSSRKGNGIAKGTEANINDRDEYLPSITILEEEYVKELPYRELKWEHVPGRWMGYGYVEYLEENQIATNEAENLERKGLAFTSLKLYTTQDEALGGLNVLTDAQNGDILSTTSALSPVANEERNLAAFNATRTRWDQNTERKTFTSDVARGGDLPSRTPLGVANLQAGMVSSFFEFKQENYGIFVKNLLLDDIIPSFSEETQREHILTFAGSDEELDKLDKAIIDVKVADAILLHAEKTGFFPSALVVTDARERIQEDLKRQRNRYLKIPDSFYKDCKYMVDILVTGEQMDVGAQSQTLNTILQIIGTNPGILQNKTTRSLLFEFAALGGISPVKLNMLAEDVDMTPMQVAGSLAGGAGAPGMAPTATQL